MTKAVEQYASDHRNARWSGAPAWLASIRDDAIESFRSLGFPTAHDEEWRFTSIAPIADTTFSRPAELNVKANDLRPPAHVTLTGGVGAELVFVDGHFAFDLSNLRALPRGVAVERLSSAFSAHGDEVQAHLARLAPYHRQPFTALNTAFLADGAYVQLPARAIVQEPIHLLFLSTGEAGHRPLVSHPRVLVRLDEGSQASIVESYASLNGGRYLTNAVTEIALGENAVLDHYKLQYESQRSYHVGSMHVRARRGARFASHSISLGGELVRNDVATVLDGEGVECTLNGLYLAGGERLVDNHTAIDHTRPHCASRQIYKGILADRARGVFNGKIVVRPDAQKTDAKQTNRALLLSEDARINTKPQLEIFANDVKCTHGAAVGQLDDEAVFYLTSRGLSASEARGMLIQAFADDLLDHAPLESIKAGVRQMLARQLARVSP